MINRILIHREVKITGSFYTGSYFPTQSYTTASFYIIAGQSNCGRPETSSMTLSQSSVYANGPIPNQYIYNGFFNSGSFFQLTPGTDTLLVNPNNLDEFGPETALATLFSSASANSRYYFKYGIGNTYLSGTAPNDWYPGDIYNGQFKDNLRQAVVSAKLNYTLLNLKGFIWMQGENDAALSASSYYYGDNLTFFFNDFTNYWTTLTNIYHLPSASFTKVIGRISSFGDGTEIYRSTVRAAQQNYCSTGSNNAVMINTDNYPTASDGTHYNATGQIQFGTDIYAAIGSL